MRRPTQNVRSRAAATVPAAVPRLAIRWLFAASLFLGSPAAGAAEGRTTISLNGKWQIEESVSATTCPRPSAIRSSCPGWSTSRSPRFPTWTCLRAASISCDSAASIRGRVEILAPAASLPAVGISLQERNYFWYQTSFTVPTRTAVALLKIGKAQFGTAVWLNGKKVGEHLSCWTAGYFDLTGAIQWQGENQLLVRVGAHPGVLPENLPAGTSSSKHRWTPGIYDNVAVIAVRQSRHREHPGRPADQLIRGGRSNEGQETTAPPGILSFASGSGLGRKRPKSPKRCRWRHASGARRGEES